uniref:RdRp n=1 Tax=Wenling partiti-like virus 12 TaxID=1923518 RepID=A0A1L3KLQ3_9VIRU|nr:RdRp [Wenling partiti-like virus 12]
MSLSKYYGIVKSEGYTRKCSDRDALSKWQNGYYSAQRRARTCHWDWRRIEEICEDVKRLLKPHVPLDVRPVDAVRETFASLSKSAGHSFSGTDYGTKDNIPDSELYRAEKVLDLHGQGITQPMPHYKIAFRTQIRKKKAKRRIILISPGPLAMVEKRWAAPFQAIMELVGPPIGTGFSWFEGSGSRITPLISPITKSFDFESFDNSSPTRLTRLIFDIIASSFNMSERDENIFRGIVRSHTYAKANYRGRVFRLTGGIRTGSSFTHIIGTLTGLIMTRYIFGDVPSYHYGDDFIVKTKLSIKQACLIASRTSFSLSPTKSKPGISWLGLRLRGTRWVLDDPIKRYAQIFIPPKRMAFLPRVQAAFLNCGADPMRLVLKRWLLRKHERRIPHPELDYWFPSGLETYHPPNGENSIFNIELVMKRHML